MGRYISPILYILLLLVGCFSFVSIAGVRVGLFEPITGFALLKQSVVASLLLSLMAMFSLFICRREKRRHQRYFFYLVTIVTLVYSLFWLGFYFQKNDLPEISDVTTDWVMPPEFIHVPLLRQSSENTLVYNPAWATLQQRHYPAVKPLVVKHKDKHAVYMAALGLIQDNDWELVAEYSEAGVIEATARTPIFGFHDDVIIRISRLSDDTIQVDMRSSSRVGRKDFGVNAKRIQRYMQSLQQRLVEKPLVSYAN